MTSELSAAWYHARRYFFSGRGYDCSWEDFVNLKAVLWWCCLNLTISMTVHGWLGSSQTFLDLEPWPSEGSFLEEDHCCLAFSLSPSFFLAPSLLQTVTHSPATQAAGYLSSTCDSQGPSAEHQVSVETQRHLVTARQWLYCNFRLNESHRSKSSPRLNVLEGRPFIHWAI